MIEKHSITIKGHQTSITLEKEFWDELKQIAIKNNKSIGAIVAEIDSQNIDENLSSAIRIFVFQTLKNNL